MRKPFPFNFKRLPQNTTSRPPVPAPSNPGNRAMTAPVAPAPLAAPATSRVSRFKRALSKRRGPTQIAMAGARVREANALAKPGESLGGIFTKTFAPGVAAFAVGNLDETKASRWLEDRTGGFVNASLGLAIAGALARGADLDGRVPLIGQYVKQANIAMLTGAIPAKMYGLGRRSGKGLFGKVPAAAKPVDAVPGEASAA